MNILEFNSNNSPIIQAIFEVDIPNNNNSNEHVNLTSIDLLLSLLQRHRNIAIDNVNGAYFKFVVEGVLLSSVSIFGLLGNIISIVVLSRPVMKGPFSTLLLGLTAFDTLYLLGGLAIFGLPALSSHYLHNMLPVIISTCFGLGHIGRVGSVYLTVSITVERYLAIAYPFRHFWQNKCLLPGSIIVAILYNIPKFFEIESKLDKETGFNRVSGTALRANNYYVTYYIFWSKFILVEIIPYVIIIILNFLIIRQIRCSEKFRRECTVPNLNPEAAARHLRNINLAVILITISTLFIFCQSVKIIPDLYEAIFCRLVLGPQGFDCETTPLMERIISISHLLLAINSSTNFLIYIWKGRKFREMLCSCLRRKRSIEKTSKSFRSQSSWVRGGPRKSSKLNGEDSCCSWKMKKRAVSIVSSSYKTNNNNSSKNKNVNSNRNSSSLKALTSLETTV